MSFNSIKDWFSQQQASLSTNISRYRNKEFMEAVVAGCAMVAAADGQVGANEKQKMAGYISRSEELKVFDMQEVIKRFQDFAGGFEFDYMVGKAEALKFIGKLKGKDEAARLLISVCCAIGMADGDFDDKEKEVIREICRSLGLNTADFGL